MEKDKKFSFFESYHRALSKVSDERYGRVVRKMSDYVFFNEEPTFEDEADSIVWELIKPILEHGREISNMRAKAGAMGGRNGKGTSRNVGNDNAKQKQNNSKQKQNNSGIGIGEGKGKGYKESTNVPKKNISLPISERMKKFQNELSPYLGKYGKDMLNDFYEYWAEPDRKGNKMRFELEKTWNLSSRLSRWQRRGNNGKSC